MRKKSETERAVIVADGYEEEEEGEEDEETEDDECSPV